MVLSCVAEPTSSSGYEIHDTGQSISLAERQAAEDILASHCCIRGPLPQVQDHGTQDTTIIQQVWDCRDFLSVRSVESL